LKSINNQFIELKHCRINNKIEYNFPGVTISLAGKKVKQSRYRAGQAQRVLRKLGFPDFVTTAQDGGGRLSALRTARLYPQEIHLVLISVRG